MPANPNAPAGVQPKAFPEVLRAHMGRQRLYRKALAGKVGVSQNYLAMRLRDEVPFTVNDIENVAAALRLPLPQLMAEVAATAKRLEEEPGGPDDNASAATSDLS